MKAVVDWDDLCQVIALACNVEYRSDEEQAVEIEIATARQLLADDETTLASLYAWLALHSQTVRLVWPPMVAVIVSNDPPTDIALLDQVHAGLKDLVRQTKEAQS